MCGFFLAFRVGVRSAFFLCRHDAVTSCPHDVRLLQGDTIARSAFSPLAVFLPPDPLMVVLYVYCVGMPTWRAVCAFAPTVSFLVKEVQ